MKKTLITLLALAGVACGAQNTSELVTDIQNSLQAQSYVTGDSFTITFTLEDAGWTGANWAGVLKLGTSFGTNSDKNDQIRIETSSTGMSPALIGFAVDAAALGSGGESYWTAGTRAWDSTTQTYTITMSSPASTWMQFTENATTGDTAKADNGCNLAGASITLAYDHVAETSTFQVVNSSGVTSILTFTDAPVWDASKIASAYDATTWGDSVNVSVTHAVPEPATATLSLLALAGLAARRRRK